MICIGSPMPAPHRQYSGVTRTLDQVCGTFYLYSSTPLVFQKVWLNES
jgi:hypothetical protein